MVTLSTAREDILKSDRVPVFVGAYGFQLKKGLQSTSFNKEIPNEIIDEQGNTKHRAISINSPQITMSFEDLNVDLDMEQTLSKEYAEVGDFTDGVLSLWESGDTAGLVIKSLAPTDKISKVVISYVGSGATDGYLKAGVGGKCVKSGSASVTMSTSADADNLRIGDTVLLQENGGTLNVASAVTTTITNISGASITLSSNILSGVTPSGALYIMTNDTSFPTGAKFLTSGVPNVSVKGIEVYNFNAQAISGASTTSAIVDEITLTPAGTVTALESNDWRGNTFDMLVLYNDYSDNLIYSEYFQDLGITGLNVNGTAEGNATASYDFSTGKSLKFTGYVNRRTLITGTLSAVVDLDGDSGNIFKGSEAPIAIGTNGTFNEDTFSHYFLKVATLTPSGAEKPWDAKSSTVGLVDDEYHYNDSTKVLTFGSNLPAGTRVEVTYLCDASYVAEADAYKFSASDFELEKRTPSSIGGKYQPVYITTSNISSETRTDGIESCSISLSFTRDFYNTQGIAAQRIKPGDIGTVEGTLTTWVGFSKTLNLLNTGSYTSLTANQQIDAYASAQYTQNNDMPLSYTLYDPKDNVTVVKKVLLNKIQITGEDTSNSVGDDSTYSVTFSDKEGGLEFSR